MGMGQEGGGEGAEGILGEETDGRGGWGRGRVTGTAWGCRGAHRSPSDQEGDSRQRAGRWGRRELGAGGAVQDRNSRGGGSQILGQGRPVFRALSVTCLQFFIIIYPVTANLFLHIFPLYCVVFRE